MSEILPNETDQNFLYQLICRSVASSYFVESSQVFLYQLILVRSIKIGNPNWLYPILWIILESQDFPIPGWQNINGPNVGPVCYYSFDSNSSPNIRSEVWPRIKYSPFIFWSVTDRLADDLLLLQTTPLASEGAKFYKLIQLNGWNMTHILFCLPLSHLNTI